jgi:hypothetical protein
MRTSAFDKYVHEISEPFANGDPNRFHVACRTGGRYEWPTSARVRRATGCSGEYGPLRNAPGFPTRKQALAAARRMFPDA